MVDVMEPFEQGREYEDYLDDQVVATGCESVVRPGSWKALHQNGYRVTVWMCGHIHESVESAQDCADRELEAHNG